MCLSHLIWEEQHGQSRAWARHGKCESAFNGTASQGNGVGTAWAWHGNGMGTACYVWIGLKRSGKFMLLVCIGESHDCSACSVLTCHLLFLRKVTLTLYTTSHKLAAVRTSRLTQNYYHNENVTILISGTVTGYGRLLRWTYMWRWEDMNCAIYVRLG
jgi:hypothetical protein